ncbi:hypothetical protein [Corallococcus terminator]|uniref:hypothetical protein n=1 Tax=Corallococcus terminator TaxID=2316733 RepID=UPI00131590EA|nr:hypothetical protein [Corallococcus terminator]
MGNLLHGGILRLVEHHHVIEGAMARDVPGGKLKARAVPPPSGISLSAGELEQDPAVDG